MYVCLFAAAFSQFKKGPLLPGQTKGCMCHPGHIQYNKYQARVCMYVCVHVTAPELFDTYLTDYSRFPSSLSAIA